MSDGMSDARAEAQLDRDVWCAAFDLAEIAVKLSKAIMRARMGHRGWGTPRSEVVRMANEALGRTGFALVDKEPEKSFENYRDDAYRRDVSWREKALERRHAALLEVLKLFADLYKSPGGAGTGDPIMIWSDDARLAAAAATVKQDEEEKGGR